MRCLVAQRGDLVVTEINLRITIRSSTGRRCRGSWADSRMYRGAECRMLSRCRIIHVLGLRPRATISDRAGLHCLLPVLEAV